MYSFFREEEILHLYNLFLEEEIEAHEVWNLDLEDLEGIGVESEKAHRILEALARKKTQQETNIVLKNHLTAMGNPELYDILCQNGILADKLITLSKHTMKKMGITLGRTKRFLEKIKNHIAGI